MDNAYVHEEEVPCTGGVIHVLNPVYDAFVGLEDGVERCLVCQEVAQIHW